MIRSANPGSHSLAGLARSKLMNLINRKSACGGWIDNPIGIPRKLQPGRLGKESGMTVLSPLGRKIVAGSQKSDSFVPQLHQMIQNQLNAPVMIDVDAIKGEQTTGTSETTGELQARTGPEKDKSEEPRPIWSFNAPISEQEEDCNWIPRVTK